MGRSIGGYADNGPFWDEFLRLDPETQSDALNLLFNADQPPIAADTGDGRKPLPQGVQDALRALLLHEAEDPVDDDDGDDRPAEHGNTPA